MKDVEYIMLMFQLEENQEDRSLYPHIIPVSGLVISSIVRLSTECRTVLEMWISRYQIPPSNKNYSKKLEKYGISDPNSFHDPNTQQSHLHFNSSPSGNAKVKKKFIFIFYVVNSNLINFNYL